MQYSIENLPIVLKNKSHKIAVTVTYLTSGISAILSLFFFCLFEYEKLAADHPDPTVMIAEVATFGAFAIITGLYGRAESKVFSEIVIDNEGILISSNKQKKKYRWRDLSSVNYIIYERRYSTKVLQLKLKYEIMKDKESDLVWNEYDISDKELIEVIRCGIRKWGGS